MKIQTKTTVRCALLLLTAFASSGAQADRGWLVGGAIGSATVDDDINGNRFKADGTAFRVYGGFQFNDFFAVDVSYIDLGTFEDTFQFNGQNIPVSANADGFMFGVMGIVPVSERFSAHGRAGMFFWDGQSTVNGITENDPSDQNPYVGLGLAYKISDQVDINLDVDYFDLDDAQPLVASVGFAVRF